MKHQRFIPPLLTCLFALFPLVVQAQHLTGYDYWFDGDLSTLVSKSLSGYEAEVDADIPTQHLSDGLHTLYLRVRQSGGEYNYSAVTSSVFFKHNVSEGNQIEYWFDDRYDDRVSMSLPQSATEELTEINFDMRDDTKFPMGLHQLNLRVSTEGKSLSSIFSAWVLKITSGDADLIEYWVDGDFASRKSVSGHLSVSGENDYVFVDPFDLTGIPAGMHKVYYRVASSNGSTKSAVSMATVVVGCGDTSTLEYWIDDDREYVGTISGHEASAGDKGFIFNHTLDLSDVSAGVHRLHYRGINSNGISQTAISTTPIMVKSKYNVSSADAKVTQYSLSVDNEEPVMVKLGNPGNDITFERDFDVHDLTPGTHTVKAKFWNSLGAGVGEEAQFTMTVPETPVINLTATEKDGIVLLLYDIPANQQNYRLLRKDTNGAKATVFRDDVFRGWEVNDWFNDAPPAGSYTYYVESVSYDDEGNRHLLTSNEVNINVEQAQDELKNCGYVTGYIVPTYGAALYHDIFYSDGVRTRTYDKFFQRQMIPAGTNLTISVEGNNYEKFETATITIKPGENHVKLKDLSNLAEMESKPNNYSNDLEFCSDLDWVGSNYQFAVKNVTRNTWSGYVRLRIITKEKALKEKENEEEGGDTTNPSEEEDYDEITPGLRAEDNYVYVYSDEIKKLKSGESVIVSLSLDNVFAPDKKEWYYIYFESVGKWNSDPEGAEKVKLIGVDYDYSITENPMLKMINKKDLTLAVTKQLMQDAEYGANIILACCSKLDQLNGLVGNMGDVGWKEIFDKLGEKKPLDLMKLNQYVDEAIETESAAEFKEDLMIQAILFDIFGYNCLDFANKFREDIANDIFKYSKGVDDYLSKAMKVLKYIRDYRAWERMDDYERFFYCADAILDAADRYTDTPICSMLKVYTKIGRSLIQKALEYGETYYDNYAASFLKENAPSKNDKPKMDYNRHVDYKIMVRANYWMDFLGYEYFNFEKNGTSPIREVVVKAHNIPTSPNTVATFFFDLVPVSDGVMLKQTGMDNENALDDQKPIDRMWMEIKWKNGRITKVPLRDDIDGVTFKGATLGQLTNLYTVYLQSGTTKFDNMADDIEIKE